ncbi:ribonucleoside-diphosphate reductase subunit alpha [Heyndrickxia camelliae]|uniref:Ribonucleoside-diphosphate reductase n=1 Tax=Heyndrickxia camelliae TaxID=1707093 RepID=A0A2N3LG18_9BACI|nr:ribonucleoside-diphosphate reductase subunit alpha [Heyndrickxia camelliae]PKR83549.1 ribonucleoside-diphosphate reductase subunit alpha [Heyndrickxia camelliae]
MKGCNLLTLITKNKGRRKLPYDQNRLEKYIDNIMQEFPNLDTQKYKQRIFNTITSSEEFRAAEITNKLILNALDNITIEEPQWTYVASRLFLKRIYKEAAYNRSYDDSKKYGNFYGLLKTLGEKGIYSELILKEYTREEIELAEGFIDPDKDNLFTYIGLKTLVDRYLAKDHDGKIFELPQERALVVSMVLMSKEDKSKRMDLVKESYWALSNQYMTVATPTWSNAGKSYGQLSSCFIDTVEDSLQGIFDSNTDVANLSKNAGGIGVYLGKIRAKNSDIKGFKGASSGVIPWMRQLNNTAVSVDQLGTRQGSIAVYLDVWHKDIFPFLEAKLNNGDERFKTHDLFTGVCLPDLFMEQVEKRGDWYLFDPHEIEQVMGYSLEDFYDEKEGEGSFRDKYEECVQCNELHKEKVPAIEIMKAIMKSQLETGTPFMFYRDEVNRKNPNKHAGMIYSSNLCTEIMENMSPTSVTKQYTDDGKIIIEKQAGDFVVCNLSSVHLGNTVKDDVLERLIPIQIRMLDNVIDLNNIPVLQAQLTNQKYRGIGLGTFSWHQLLALKGIRWESEEAVDYADKLYEKIAYLAIKASSEIAKEKGTYKVFEGSEWQTGKYFERRNYGELDDGSRLVTNEQWDVLKQSVQSDGMRNAWLFAVAPNGSTSILGNGTASIDPVFNRLYFEEKKNYKIPVTVPDLNPKTTWFYNSAYEIDQLWSIKQNAARQKHIDQSQSFNLYVKNNIKAKDLLELHMTAWKLKLKTSYYVRSTAVDITECETCAS